MVNIPNNRNFVGTVTFFCVDFFIRYLYLVYVWFILEYPVKFSQRNQNEKEITMSRIAMEFSTQLTYLFSYALLFHVI